MMVDEIRVGDEVRVQHSTIRFRVTERRPRSRMKGAMLAGVITHIGYQSVLWAVGEKFDYPEDLCALTAWYGHLVTGEDRGR